jgi:hypothetical protein
LQNPGNSHVFDVEETSTPQMLSSDLLVETRGLLFEPEPRMSESRDRGPAARRIASEFMRCGPSVGANAEEAQDGQTKPDFLQSWQFAQRVTRKSLLAASGDQTEQET